MDIEREEEWKKLTNKNKRREHLKEEGQRNEGKRKTSDSGFYIFGVRVQKKKLVLSTDFCQFFDE
jgi:hypothetical protein